MQARRELPAELEPQLRTEINAEINDALAYAESRAPKPPLASLFEDVYAEMPWHLREQRKELEAEIAAHGPKIPPHGS